MFMIIVMILSFVMFLKLFMTFGKGAKNAKTLPTVAEQEQKMDMKDIEKLISQEILSESEKMKNVEHVEKLDKEIVLIKKHFPNFSPDLFLTKSEEIFDSVLNAFANAHHHTLIEKLTEKLYKSFGEQMQKRENANFKQEILIKHKKTAIETIQVLANKAKVFISFDVAQMSAIINSDGVSFDNPKRIYRDVIYKWIFDSKIDDEKWILSQTSCVEK